MEIPSRGGGKHYPLPFKKEQKIAEKYFKEMPKGVFSIGRAGTYTYGVDIDDCIRHSMLVVDRIKNGFEGHPVPGIEYRFPELNRS